jgi:ectoine hydroxylase-related dioxygenase (phytanoyl-CoA dioxygenase family)
VSTTYEVTATDEQVAAFQANGYLAIDQITTPDEVVRLRELYDQVMEDKRAWRLVYEGAADDGDVINQVFLPELQAPEMGDTQYFRNARGMAARLLGVSDEEVTPGGLMLIYKPPTGGREAPWHQDEAFWDDRNAVKCHSLSVWMPLDDVVIESGAMQFLPGSHQNDVLRHRSEPGEPLFVDEPVDLSPAVACPLPAGGATFHHCRTLHHTARNTSGRPRRAMTTIFHGPSTPRETPFEKPWIKGLEAPKQG